MVGNVILEAQIDLGFQLLAMLEICGGILRKMLLLFVGVFVSSRQHSPQGCLLYQYSQKKLRPSLSVYPSIAKPGPIHCGVR